MINIFTAQKMKFSINDFSSKCDQIRSFLRIWPHLLEKSLIENFIFCAVFMGIWKKTQKIELRPLVSEDESEQSKVAM